MRAFAQRAVVCALACAGAAAAAPVSLVGTDIDLVYDPALLGSFGAPTLAGNSFFFTLNEQRAESTNGAGSQVQAGGQLRVFDAAQPGAAVVATTLQADAGLALGSNDGSTRNWTALAHIDGASVAADGGVDALAAGAGRVGLEIDLRLSAYTDPTQTGFRQAFIENKFSGLMVTVASAGPVALAAPSTLALLSPLLLGLLLTRVCSDLARHHA